MGAGGCNKGRNDSLLHVRAGRVSQNLFILRAQDSGTQGCSEGLAVSPGNDDQVVAFTKTA